MIINILVGIAVIIAAYIGYYLLSHLKKTMFNISVQDEPRLKSAAKNGGWVVFIFSDIGNCFTIDSKRYLDFGCASMDDGSRVNR